MSEASARDLAAAQLAAHEEGWAWNPQPPNVPSPAAAMLEVVRHVRASDAAWDAEHPPPAADDDVEWGVRSWGPWVSDVVTTIGGRDAAEQALAGRQRIWPQETHHLMQRRVSPWQRAGEPLPDLVAPPTPAPERPSLVCLDEAESAAVRVRAMHQPETYDGLLYEDHEDCDLCEGAGHEQECCRECSNWNDEAAIYIPWPCRTARALDAPEQLP